MSEEKIRVQKFLSEQGVASRRKAEDFIRAKQVQINGQIAELGDKVDPLTDEVKVYGKVITAKPTKMYIALYKPHGYVVTRSDPRGRRNIYALIPEAFRDQVWSIGRLDFDTEGLLLLTNDGSLTQQLTHPKFEHEKEYEVTPDKPIKDRQIETLKKGVNIKEGKTAPAKVKRSGDKVRITIHEGKKRQVRQMFNRVGLGIHNLKRIRIGQYSLPDSLKPGEFVQIKKSAII
ncbi:MAG: pseudouridine synthase [Candidatus Doudnabacteria bacterium]